MVTVARVRRYTQQKDQLWSGHCQAVRGTEGQGPCALVQPCPGQRRAHLAACDTPLHRRWQVESAGSMFIGRMAAGPHSARTVMVREGGSRYGHTVMLARIPRRQGKCKAQTALRGGVLLADRQAWVRWVVCQASVGWRLASSSRGCESVQGREGEPAAGRMCGLLLIQSVLMWFCVCSAGNRDVVCVRVPGPVGIRAF